MTSLTKLALAALSLPLAVPATSAAAGQPGAVPEIVVAASPREVALRAWTARVQASLERKMRTPRHIGANFYGNEGLSEVLFRYSGSGRPDQVTLARSSGNPRIDRAAMSAVRRIALDPLPEGMAADQRVLAQLLFFDPGSEREAAQREQALRADAARHIVSYYRDEIASGDLVVVSAAK